MLPLPSRSAKSLLLTGEEAETTASKSSTGRCDLCPNKANAKNKLRRLTREESLQLSAVAMPETRHPGGSGTTALPRATIENPLKQAILCRQTNCADGSPVLLSLCAFCLRMLSGMGRPGKRRRNDDDESRVCKFRRLAERDQKQVLSSKCYVCELHSQRTSEETAEATNSQRIAHVGQLHMCATDVSIRPRFASEFARRTLLPLSDIDHLLTESKAGSPQSVLCNRHRQLVRHTVDAIRLQDANRMCFVPDCRARSDLRPLRVPENEAEALELEEACRTLIDGMSLIHLKGKRVCPGHRSAITRTISKSDLPQFRSEGLARLLRGIVQLCLGKTGNQPDVMYFNDVVTRATNEVRGDLQGTPFQCSSQLDSESESTGRPKSRLDSVAASQKFLSYSSRTQRSKLYALLVPRLALQGIFLERNPGNGQKYFISPQAQLEHAERRGSYISGRNLRLPSLSPTELSTHVTTFALHLKSNQKSYQNGTWSLRELILGIPPPLWSFIVWGISSNTRKTVWCSRARQMKIDRDSLHLQLWPVSNAAGALPPEGQDLFSCLQLADISLVRRCATIIEQMAMARSNVPGPILTALGVSVYSSGSRQLQSLLSTCGMTCSRGLVQLLQRELVATRERQEKTTGVYASIPQGYWCFLALDNLDKASPHMLNVRNMATSGLHVTFGSLHAIELPPHSLQRGYPDPEPLRACLDRFSTREQLVEHFVPKQDDVDLVAFQNIFLGLVQSFAERLTAECRPAQLSLRRLLFSALTANQPRDSKVVLARLEDFKATNHHELLRVVEESVQQLRDADSSAPILGVVGDCPTYVILWTRWVALLKEGKEPHWFPVPGGAAFHDWKSGCFPALKSVFEGSFYEDLIASGRSGLSQYAVDNYSTLSNLRKNRRVTDQCAVAQVLVAADSLRAIDADFSDTMDRLETSNEQFLGDSAQKAISDTGSSLLVEGIVTNRVYLKGEALRIALRKQASQSETSDFYLRLLLLDHVIPIIASQSLLRVGQTTAYNKFWFALAPLIMSTTQTNYQKLIVMQMYVLSVLPCSVVEDLLLGDPGCLVVCREGNSAIAQYPHDERLECNVKIVKEFLGLGPGDRLNCIYWISELSRLRDCLAKELKINARMTAGDYGRDADGVLLGYDREARGAVNVKVYVERMREKEFLSAEHLSCDGLQNWLGENKIIAPSGKLVSLLLNLRSTGLKKLEILVSRLLPPYFVAVMSASDMAALSLKRALKFGRWTRAGAVRSLISIVSSLSVTTGHRKPASFDPVKQYLLHTKRVAKQCRLLQKVALDPNMQVQIRAEAERALSRLRGISTLVSSQSTSYGEWVGAGEHRRRASRPAVKSNYFRSLQTYAHEKLGVAGRFMREDGRLPSGFVEAHIDVENIVHGSLAATGTSHSCGAILREKCKQSVAQVARGSRGKHLKVLHLHADVGAWTVRTKDETADRRTERRNQSLSQVEGPSFEDCVDAVIIQRREKEIFTSACLIFCAVEALGMQSESSGALSELVAFCHGGDFAVHVNAFGKPAKDLKVIRSPPGAPGLVLVCWVGIGSKYREQDENAVVHSLRESSTPFNPGGGPGTDSEIDRTRLSASVVQEHVPVSFWNSDVRILPRETCLAFSKSNGLHILNQGCSRHGEGETRIAFAHLNVTRPLLDTLSEPAGVQPRVLELAPNTGTTRAASSGPLPGADSTPAGGPTAVTSSTEHLSSGHEDVQSAHHGESGMAVRNKQSFTCTRKGCVVISMDSDCPAISCAVLPKISGFGFVHVVGSQVIDIDALSRVLQLLHISPAAIVYGYAMGGCDFTPAPFRIPHFAFTKAILETSVGAFVENELRRMELLVPAPDTCMHVSLTSATYAMTRMPADSWKGLVPSIDFFFTPNEITSYAEQVREEVQDSATVDSESMLLPQDSDITLQGARCLWVLHYWKGAINRNWNRWDIGEAGPESGFVLNERSGRYGNLYEPVGAPSMRERKIADAFRCCGCVKCNTRRCSCVRSNRVCIPGICRKCSRTDSGTCENAGQAMSGTAGQNGVLRTQLDVDVTSTGNLPPPLSATGSTDCETASESDNEEDATLVLPIMASDGTTSGIDAFFESTSNEETAEDGALRDLDVVLNLSDTDSMSDGDY